MIPEADADARRQPVRDERDGDGFPSEEERSGDATGVNADHPQQHGPVDVIPAELIGVEPVVNFLRRDRALDAGAVLVSPHVVLATPTLGSNHSGHQSLPYLVSSRIWAEYRPRGRGFCVKL